MQNQGSGTGHPQGPQRERPASGDMHASHADKWPPQLLQAHGFRPNRQSPEKPSARRGGGKLVGLLAIFTLTAGVGWSTADTWLPSGLAQMAGFSAQKKQLSAEAREMQKLARVETSTLTRVLSDLRILQSAFANLQGQVANLPPKSDVDGLVNDIKALKSSLASVTSRVKTAQIKHASTIGALAAKLAAAELASTKVTSELAARIAGLEKKFSGSEPVASSTSSKIERTARVSEKVKTRKKPRFGYMVRDVHRGVALVESRAGEFLEVYPGMSIPGAGWVRSIKRRGGKWVVVTSRGTIDSRPY